MEIAAEEVYTWKRLYDHLERYLSSHHVCSLEAGRQIVIDELSWVFFSERNWYRKEHVRYSPAGRKKKKRYMTKWNTLCVAHNASGGENMLFPGLDRTRGIRKLLDVGYFHGTGNEHKFGAGTQRL